MRESFCRKNHKICVVQWMGCGAGSQSATADDKLYVTRSRSRSRSDRKRCDIITALPLPSPPLLLASFMLLLELPNCDVTTMTSRIRVHNGDNFLFTFARTSTYTCRQHVADLKPFPIIFALQEAYWCAMHVCHHGNTRGSIISDLCFARSHAVEQCITDY